MDVKRCNKCKESKPLADFYTVRRNKDGKHGSCKPCASAVAKVHNRARIQQRLEYNRRWREANPDKVAAWRPRNRAVAAASYAARRREVIDSYGGVCTCCGLDDYRFLSIDHIDGVPAHHRKKDGSRMAGTGVINRLWTYLQENGSPDPSCTTLCHNCNCARATNGGLCPHKEVMPSHV